MKDEDTVAQEAQAMAEQGAPQDPRMAAAQLGIQAKQMDLQDRDKQRAFEMTKQEREIAVRERTLAYNIERERAESEQSARDAALSRDLALLKMDREEGLSREELDRKERLELVKVQDQRERFNAEAALRVRTGSGI
jgi:hypothetical protein